jgi:glycine dehydrogenase subunit 1
LTKYIPNTDDDIKLMLKTIGVKSVDELFADIPDNVLLKKLLDLPDPVSEIELMAELRDMAKMNLSAYDSAYFIGGGAYNHYIPSIINHMISRAEFYTAYTPYQPEVSQGTLQVIFEYQTMIADLLGMEIANASMYDGASSFAEAILMAKRQKKDRNKVLIPKALNPAYKMVMNTYIDNSDIQVIEIPYSSNGTLDKDILEKNLDEKVLCLAVQNPNYFGCIEDLESLKEIISKREILLIGVVTEALSLGLLNPPGFYGADIVVGEGQSLGIPMSFGGPYLGLFATKMEFMRQVPGRLCGQTVDKEGKRGFVLTVSTREQHIRREKATSNICTNQGLCALIASIYISTMGKAGIREVALQNLEKTDYAKNRIAKLTGYQIVFDTPVFNEFLVRCPVQTSKISELLLKNNMVGGLDISCYYPELNDCMLFTFTELVKKCEIDRLCELLMEASR